MILSYEFLKFLQYLMFSRSMNSLLAFLLSNPVRLPLKSKSTSGTEVLKGTDDLSCEFLTFLHYSCFRHFHRARFLTLENMKSEEIWKIHKT